MCIKIFLCLCLVLLLVQPSFSQSLSSQAMKEIALIKSNNRDLSILISSLESQLEIEKKLLKDSNTSLDSSKKKIAELETLIASLKLQLKEDEQLLLKQEELLKAQMIAWNGLNLSYKVLQNWNKILVVGVGVLSLIMLVSK